MQGFSLHAFIVFLIASEILCYQGISVVFFTCNSSVSLHSHHRLYICSRTQS